MTRHAPVPSEIRPKPGVSAAIFRGHAVLLVERARPPFAGAWSLPGGEIEWGETAETAALRELGEETGIEAELIGLVDVADVQIRDGEHLIAHHVIAVFAGRWQSGEALASSDAADVRWADPDELADIRLTPNTLAVIEKAAQLVKGAK